MILHGGLTYVDGKKCFVHNGLNTTLSPLCKPGIFLETIIPPTDERVTKK